jgi:predicted NAD/FAD-binding protein
MLQDLLRFNRETNASMLPDETLGSYLVRQRYSTEFRDWYLLPMAAAIWSAPTQAILDYPLTTFVRFCRNHGLLQVFDRPQWMTVKGGGRDYVKRIAARLDDVRLETPVHHVLPDADGVWLALPGGERERFDQVVMACHSDQALGLLGDQSSEDERALLGAIRYQPNRAVLHTDPALLPRDERVWSAWNYMAGDSAQGDGSVSVSYLINRLQPLPFAQPIIVSLNPHREPAAKHVIGDYDYAHPLFDQAAVRAQSLLPQIQGKRRLWFCGAWSGYGFHEDGLKSALTVVNGLGIQAPWQIDFALGHTHANANQAA